MPTAPQLQRFVDDELARSAEMIERTLTGTLQLLRDPESGNRAALELVPLLQRQATTYRNHFVQSLASLVSDELAGLADDTPAHAVHATRTALGLELMDESRVEVDIEISRAAQLIDSTTEWELRELQTFTSALVGQSHVSPESNPLRPLVYATALWEAACAVVFQPAQQALVLRISAGVLAGLLKNAWAAACTRLEAQGVEPSVYRTVVFGPGTAPERTFDVTLPGALGELMNRLSEAPAVTSAPVHEPPLLELRAAPIGDAAIRGGRSSVELLSRLFEVILADRHLPLALSAVIARLQVSALRVAMQDGSVLTSHNHPVWQLIERMAGACAIYPQPTDPRLNALLRCCTSVAEDIAAAPSHDVGSYRRGLARIESFLTEQVQLQLHEAEPTMRSLERAERRDTLAEHLAHRLIAQMVPVRTSAVVRRFVTGRWATVLAEAALRFGEQAETTRGYMKAVDDLLWSVQLPDHPQSRQRLLSLLPGLLQQLRSGMALISLPAAEQQTVLDELMAIHTEALRPGTRGATGVPLAEQIVAYLPDGSLRDPSRLSPFGDSVIDIGSMDTVPAGVLHTEAQRESDALTHSIEVLRPGGTLRLLLYGRWTRVQLLWRSEQAGFYLFAGETPDHTHSITRRALERLAAEGLVQPIEAQPLVQRAADRLMRKLASPI